MSVIRIKRRALGGAVGAPASLENAELAYNEQDNILYYGQGTGGVGGSATQIISIGGPGAFARLNSPTFTGTVTVPTATSGDNSTAAASTAFVQTAVNSAVQGLDPKASVRAASTANIVSLSGTPTIDNVALVVGNRFLVKNQDAPAENGIYVVADGAWTRSLDMDAWTEIPGAYVFVEEGTLNKDGGFVCTADTGGTLGSTAIPWITFAGAGSVAAGNGISVTGTTVTAVGTASRISVGATIDIDSSYVGQTSITTLGTVTSGTWSATSIGVTKGGTGLSAAITGLLLGNGTSYGAAVAGTDFLAPASTIDGGTF